MHCIINCIYSDIKGTAYTHILFADLFLVFMSSTFFQLTICVNQVPHVDFDSNTCMLIP